MNGKRTKEMGAGTFDHRIGDIFNIFKMLLVTAIDLTEIKMPDLIADLHQQLD